MSEEFQHTPHTIEELKAKLAARKGRPGFKRNCEQIEAEIGRMEAACPDCGNAPPPKP